MRIAGHTTDMTEIKDLARIYSDLLGQIPRGELAPPLSCVKSRQSRGHRTTDCRPRRPLLSRFAAWTRLHSLCGLSAQTASVGGTAAEKLDARSLVSNTPAPSDCSAPGGCRSMIFQPGAASIAAASLHACLRFSQTRASLLRRLRMAVIEALIISRVGSTGTSLQRAASRSSRRNRANRRASSSEIW